MLKPGVDSRVTNVPHPYVLKAAGSPKDLLTQKLGTK